MTVPNILLAFNKDQIYVYSKLNFKFTLQFKSLKAPLELAWDKLDGRVKPFHPKKVEKKIIEKKNGIANSDTLKYERQNMTTNT